MRTAISTRFYVFEVKITTETSKTYKLQGGPRPAVLVRVDAKIISCCLILSLDILTNLYVSGNTIICYYNLHIYKKGNQTAKECNSYKFLTKF
jgi:hypothetical protein